MLDFYVCNILFVVTTYMLQMLLNKYYMKDKINERQNSLFRRQRPQRLRK